jgi:sec-independent protein translocase protein TatC
MFKNDFSLDDVSLASIWDHFADLRKALLQSIAIIFIGMALSGLFYEQIFTWVTAPLQEKGDLQKRTIHHERITNQGIETVNYILPAATDVIFLSPNAEKIDPITFRLPPGAFVTIEKGLPSQTLAIFKPAEGLSLCLKLCFWVGLIGTLPFWINPILSFIRPGLYRHEQKLLIPFMGASLLAVASGICFAYFLTIPIANTYLFSFNASLGQNLWGLAEYVNYSLSLFFAHALAFEAAVVLIFLVHLGFLRHEHLVGKQRHAIVAAFILGALLTPPDIPSQVMVAVPLIGLYQLIILYAKVRG